MRLELLGIMVFEYKLSDEENFSGRSSGRHASMTRKPSARGGKVSSDLHQDFIIPKPTWMLNGKPVMKDGKLLA